MRILLDGCLDWRLARSIVGHDVRTARQMGCTAIQNGELLSLASREFDLFVTVDRNLAFQQNVADLPISVVVILANSKRLADLLPLVPELLNAITSLKRGTLRLVP